MIQSYAIAAATILLLVIISFIANQRLQSLDKIPMQWGMDRRPTWYAPRLLGLAFTPMLALGVLSTVAGLTASMQYGYLNVLVLGLVFLGIHLFHLRLIRNSPQ